MRDYLKNSVPTSHILDVASYTEEEEQEEDEEAALAEAAAISKTLTESFALLSDFEFKIV